MLEKLESLVEHIGSSLLSLGFFKIVSPDDMKRFWRDILIRAALSGREADRMRAIFSKISGIGRRREEPQLEPGTKS